MNTSSLAMSLPLVNFHSREEFLAFVQLKLLFIQIFFFTQDRNGVLLADLRVLLFMEVVLV
jgi:hypothetical protein